MYSIIDIETTGGNAWTDRITEVAVFVHDGQKVVKHFSSLVNPERSIPPFVSRLTGITDAMVKDAPLFEEIARELVELTADTIFVGHNVQFDYSFIRQEFKALGYQYEKQTLCTCKLSRKLIPGHSSYSLGKLCHSLGIQIVGRHRAAGDAEATVSLFEKLLIADTYGELELALKPVKFSSLPECLNSEKIYGLPERPGIYYFHNQQGEIIYIGKSKNIRKRVLSHFKKKNPLARDARMRRDLADVTFHQTGTELIALLMETEEIKKHLPQYNKAKKTREFQFGLFDEKDSSGYIRLHIDKISSQKSIPIASFKNVSQALQVLHQKIDEFKLCGHLCGIEEGDGSCFRYQIKKCLGACIMAEDPLSYNKRIDQLITGFHFQHPRFFIIDHGRNAREKSVVQVDNGQYSGFGYFDPSQIGNSIEELKEIIKNYPDHPDSRSIIQSHLRTEKKVQLLTY